MKHYFSCLKGDTIKAILLVCLAVGVVGMSYGSLAMAYGFPLWVPFLLSISVLAGASEFMFIGIVASGGNPLAAAAAGLLVNARHVPFGVTVRDLVGKRATGLLGCHIMNDESVVFGLSQKTPEQRKAAYWLCGLGVAIVWPLGTMLGAGVGKLLPAPETIGLDAVFPAILLALVVPALRAKGISSATHSDHKVSRLGLPFPDSSCESVDLAIPARRAISASESPVRMRSRTRLLAITLIGCVIKRPHVLYIERIVHLDKPG